MSSAGRYKDYVFGVLKSMHDPRDWVAESIFPAREEVVVPEILDHRPRMKAVRDQGPYPTCAAFAASSIKEYQERLDISFDQYMSPTFVYCHRSNYPADGMYLRDVCQILQKNGSCGEILVPYNSVTKRDELSTEAVEIAARHKIMSYAQVFTIDGLKTALYKNGPCLIAFPVYNYGATFWRKEGEQTLRGGHAVSVVGYDRNGFIIRNSWGDDWNGSGYTIYPYTQFGMHWEIWSSIDDKSPIPEPPVPRGCC